MKKHIFILAFILSAFAVNAQDIDPNGYNVFYYPNGNISAEGNMNDGEPDGYWKNYHENGILKSEGKRLYSELDSIWNFYDQDGELISAITYRNDKKNGYTKSYSFYYTEDSTKVYYHISKELFLNGRKEGLAYYYHTTGYLEFTYNYVRDTRNGNGKEYNKDSLPVTLFSYYNGFLIDQIRINRLNPRGEKQGKWIEFHPNGNKKIEATYKNGKLHGIYREYNLAEKLIKEKRYVRGKVFVPKPEDEVVLKAEVKKSFHENGKIMFQGAFLNNMPVGIHKEYDENGKLIINKEYTSNSILLGEGLFDKNGQRTGDWKLFDAYQEYFYSSGNYKDGKMDGKWTYYYPNMSVEMEGFYNEDKADREWIWFYPNGRKKREEVYMFGKKEGLYVEYDSLENIILKGEYFDDARIGEWYYNVGDITEKGTYELGEKNGEWKHYYNTNGNMRFVGKYRSGDPDGTHKWYYENGNIELVGSYRIGAKNRDWKKFKENGKVYMTFTYRNNELVKIDGRKLKKRSARKK